MKSQTSDKIGIRELFSIILITIGIRITDMTPTLIFKHDVTGAWLVPIISGMFIIAPLFCLLSLLKTYRNKGLIEIIYHLTGKYVGFIICILIFITVLASTTLSSRGHASIIQSLFFENTPFFLVYALLIAGSCFIASRGWQGIGIVAWIFIPTILVIFASLVFALTSDFYIYNLFPIFGPGLSTLIKDGLVYTSTIGEFLILAVLFPFSRSYENYKLANLLGFGTVIFGMSFFFAIYLAIFDYPALEMIAYPFQITTRVAHFGRFIANVEAFYLVYWVISSILCFSVYLYLIASTFSYSLKFKEFEPLLFSFSTLIVLLGLIPKNIIEAVLFYRGNILLKYTWILYILLPIALWIAAKLKGDFRKCD
jgi:spore germination protein KB